MDYATGQAIARSIQHVGDGLFAIAKIYHEKREIGLELGQKIEESLRVIATEIAKEAGR